MVPLPGGILSRTTTSMFHKVKGKNISLDDSRNTATWNPVQSGGLIFTERPLSANDPIILNLSGTGAVELGIMCCDPATLVGRVPESTSRLEKYHFLNDVKIHKRSCTMCIKLDDKTQEVISSYGGGQYRQDIDSNKNYWLLADVKYGIIELELKNHELSNQRHQFSEYCGSNIKRLNDPSCATSRRQSPASLCFLTKPVTTSQLYVLHCSPKPYQGTIPGRYYLVLRYTNQNPEEFRQNHEDMFDLLKSSESLSSGKPGWIQIEKFEKEDCTGNPVEVDYTGSSFVYKSSSGKRSTQNCQWDNNTPIWLVLELYGISVRLEALDKDMRRVDGANCRPCNRQASNVPEVVEETDRFLSLTLSESMLEVTAEPGLVSPGTQTDSFSLSSSTSQSYRCIDDPVSIGKAIQKNFTKLRDSFIVNDFLDYMFENDMMTKNEFEQLDGMLSSNRQQVTKRVLLLLSSRPVSKKFMLMALENTKQQFLVPLFFPDEEKE